MHFTVEVERETDKRWIAEVTDLPGVMVYGATRKQAVSKAQALTLRVLADRKFKNRKPSAKRARSHATSAHLIGALRGKIRVTGDIMSTGRKWKSKS